jgi:hypothetical protein
MSLLGTHLTLLVGPTVALPAPVTFLRALESVEVSHRETGRSGFGLTFRVGRSGPFDLPDYPVVASPLLKPFNRVVLVVTVGAEPHVLMDGVITHHELDPSNEPGDSTFTVLGEDVSVMMDLEEKAVEHPALNDVGIVLKILAGYARYGVMPEVKRPASGSNPLPSNRTPVQRGTDLDYLRYLARRNGHVFYITPGPLPSMSRAYWGPPGPVSFPQKALSMNMGARTNVQSLDFTYEALEPEEIAGQVQEADGRVLPLRTAASTDPPLSARPAWLAQRPNLRREVYTAAGSSYSQARARAQAVTNNASERTVTARGEVDTSRYGGVLRPRSIVGVRGVGWTYDGNYLVRSVTHVLRRGEYRQRFALAREGTGAQAPVVRP